MNVDAGRFYQRAIDASGHIKTVDDIELARTWRSLGEVREAAGDYRGAVDALKSAARLFKDDPVVVAEIYEARSLAWARLGSYSTALRDTTAGCGRRRVADNP